MKTRKLIKEYIIANLRHNIKEARELRRKLFKKSLKGKNTQVAD